MTRILLADDHSFIRKGLTQILRDEYPFAEIMEVADGNALLNEVSLHDWDLVISDLAMPGKNGFDTLIQIKLSKPGLPVLILSMYPEERYAVKALKSGASGYLNKSAAPEELINAVHRVIAGKKYINAEIAEALLMHIEPEKEPKDLLTAKEFEIFKLLATGKTITQITCILSLAFSTVSTYRGKILHKLFIDNNAELTRYAISHHIVSTLPD
ncbi:MAG: response regulator transcription factor [Chitinophagaceae bacterium]|nr:response regulator transcription factor [Chitinophagaceae bacterium]